MSAVETGAASYILRPALDSAIAGCLASGSGVYAIEGPSGAGKSAALLHGLVGERERRGPGKASRGHVRILQLWGDETPSLFAQRLVREVGILNLVAYPRPERLAKLASEMAAAIPGLSGAGKLLGALVPDDLRPLAVIAAEALAEAGSRAIAVTEGGGPLCIGIDLLGGEVSGPVRDFFSRLSGLLPPTVVLLFAQPGGHNSLIHVPAARRIQVGPFTVDEAREFLTERMGPLDHDALAVLSSGKLSLLPGDLAQIVDLSVYLGRGNGLRDVLPYLDRGIAARYQAMFESLLGQSAADPRVLELCALCAVTSRPQQPLTLELALERMRDSPPLRPTELALVRQAPLVRALCAANATLTTTTAAAAGLAWPIEPTSAQAREGVLLALTRHGLLDVYERRWLAELLETLRSQLVPAPARQAATPGHEGLLAGVQAMALLTERARRDPLALGQAVNLLSDLETPLWRVGWHRSFAELYDALMPHLRSINLDPLAVAPRLWFRRARARVQSVDWSRQPGSEVAQSEIAQAISDLSELAALTETTVVQARLQLGLPTDGEAINSWCRRLPFKAQQARGYARILAVLFSAGASAERDLGLALDDVLTALSHFAVTGEGEDLAQTLTILGDGYSARCELPQVQASAAELASADALAGYQYAQALAVAAQQTPPPTFALGIIHRSIGNHHLRRGRSDAAAASYATARRLLLGSPDARMGTLLAGLLPNL